MSWPSERSAGRCATIFSIGSWAHFRCTSARWISGYRAMRHLLAQPSVPLPAIRRSGRHGPREVGSTGHDAATDSGTLPAPCHRSDRRAKIRLEERVKKIFRLGARRDRIWRNARIRAGHPGLDVDPRHRQCTAEEPSSLCQQTRCIARSSANPSPETRNQTRR